MVWLVMEITSKPRQMHVGPYKSLKQAIFQQSHGF